MIHELQYDIKPIGFLPDDRQWHLIAEVGNPGTPWEFPEILVLRALVGNSEYPVWRILSSNDRISFALLTSVTDEQSSLLLEGNLQAHGFLRRDFHRQQGTLEVKIKGRHKPIVLQAE